MSLERHKNSRGKNRDSLAIHRDDRRNESLRAILIRLSGVGLVLTAVGVILGAFWARQNLGRFWGWDPREIGGLSVLAWEGIIVICLLRPRRRGGMLLGVAANIVVSLAWFGPPLIEPFLVATPVQFRAHSYGVPPLAWLLAAFCLSQLLILACALIPQPWRRRQA